MMEPATVKQRLRSAWRRQREGHCDEAENVYRHVIEHAPESANAWCYLGLSLCEQRRFGEAESAYREALHRQHDFPVAWNNLGNALRLLGRNDEAIDAFGTAIKLDDKYVNPWMNLGTLWVYEQDPEKAIDAFQSGIAVQPEHAELHRNLGIVYLSQGRYREGWPEYAWRWKTPQQVRPKVNRPVWDGRPLHGKRILLYPEQGLGDTLHFIRFVQKLKAQGATTFVQAPARMIPMLTSCPGIDQLLPTNCFPRVVDYHCSLIEIAEHVCHDEENVRDSFPTRGHYLMAADNLMPSWNDWLSRHLDEQGADENSGTHANHDKPKRRIGICWQGNPQHGSDSLRSIRLDYFGRLADRSDTNLVCLQFGHGIEQLDEIPFADRITRLPSSVDRSTDAFIDTSVILKNLDLVITSDTSIAHLAGALGVPVWVALPYAADWRWGIEGDTTPWYPTMRLFRQSEKKEWESVFQSINESLDRLDRLDRLE